MYMYKLHRFVLVTSIDFNHVGFDVYTETSFDSFDDHLDTSLHVFQDQDHQTFCRIRLSLNCAKIFALDGGITSITQNLPRWTKTPRTPGAFTVDPDTSCIGVEGQIPTSHDDAHGDESDMMITLAGR